MGRLIDEDSVMKKLTEVELNNGTLTDAKIAMRDMPTAFDADAVYRKMWKESEEVCGNTMIELERANEIILEELAGGVE